MPTIATGFSSYPDRGRAARGFTLIEMAVAIFIISLLLAGILVPLQSQVESRKFEDTQRLLDQARDALLGFAAANGYLPCPADYAGASNGADPLTAANHAAGNACPASVTGTNGVYVGFLPAVTLGFTPTDAQGYAVDGWGTRQNRIRYAVSASTISGVTTPFTKTNGMRSAGLGNIQAATTLLRVCNTNAGSSATDCASAATTLTSNAVVVLWSLGPNAGTSGGVSADEAENSEAVASADRVFVMRTRSTTTASEFDDIVTWISPPLLFSRLIAAGQLP